MDAILVGIIAVSALGVLAFGVPIYNRISALREAVRSSDKSFEASLLRKKALAGEVVDLAHQVAIHDRVTHEAVARAAQEAAKEIARSIHPTIVLANLSVQFPRLRHESSFISAQQSATRIEQQIDTSLVQRNRFAEEYNTAILAFPAIIVAKALGFEEVEYREDVVANRGRARTEEVEVSGRGLEVRDDIEGRLSQLIRISNQGIRKEPTFPKGLPKPYGVRHPQRLSSRSDTTTDETPASHDFSGATAYVLEDSSQLQMESPMQTVRLPDALIADAKRLTGERSNTAAVRKLLERAIPGTDEPLTAAQARTSRQRHRADGLHLEVDRRLAALGVTEEELWGTS